MMRASILIVVFALQINANIFGQCTPPSPCSTPACSTAVSGTNYTIAAGQTLYIPVNYSSGTITLNGGTVYIQSGVTLSGSINNGTGGTINNCGTLSGSRSFSSAITVNNYSASTSMTFTNNVVVNNYAINATFTMAADNSFTFNNKASATGVTLNVNGNPNNPVTITNAASATLTVPASIDLKSGSTITNSGTITWSASFSTLKNGPTITNNSGATFKATNATSGGGMTLNINNYGTMTIAANGLTYQGGNINNYAGGSLSFTAGTITFNVANTQNYGTMSVYDLYNNGATIHMHGNSLFTVNHALSTVNNSFDSDGCAVVDISGSSTIEYSGANANLTSDPDLNVCGKVPYKTQDANSVTAATNGNPMTVTMATNTNNAVANGVKVYIVGAAGNTAINGFWTVANYSSATKTFELVGSNGATAGAYSGGATVYPYTYLGVASYLGYSNCTNPCPPLPVKFSYFNAIKEDNHVKLIWGTDYEENNKVFILQRSTDGVNYENINYITGQQDNHILLNYVEFDYSPSEGINYYRIKQIDNNGKSSFSSVAAVKFSSDGSWTIYPNPSSGSFTISSSFDAEDENIRITLVDVTGKTVREYSKKEYTTLLKVDDLAKGMYIVTIQTAESITSKKVVVQ